MRVSIDLEGLEEAVRGLNAVNTDLVDELADELKIAGTPVVAALQTYPPPIPTSSYQRTYDYQRSIQSAISVDTYGASFTAWSDAPYAIYLRGDLEGYPGAWMHRGRWRSLKDILDTFLPVVQAHLQRRIDAFLKKVGLA